MAADNTRSDKDFSYFEYSLWPRTEEITRASSAPIPRNQGSTRVTITTDGPSKPCCDSGEKKLVVLRLLIPTHKKGAILGLGGMTIMQLSDKYGCQVIITGSLKGHDHVVVIVADENDKLKAIQAFLEIHTLMYPDDVMFNVTHILARKHHASLLMGDASLPQLTENTDTYIIEEDDNRVLALPEDSIIQVFGPSLGVKEVLSFLAGRLSDFSCDVSMVSLLFVTPDFNLSSYWRKRMGLNQVGPADLSPTGAFDFIEGPATILAFVAPLMNENYPEMKFSVNVSKEGISYIKIVGHRRQVIEAKRYGLGILKRNSGQGSFKTELRLNSGPSEMQPKTEDNGADDPQE